ncbi:hypothetical protein SAMN05421770_11184 [Granulicella rosea]|uniref:Uncharacterized protein n=1 Tax=Granulicella rosea TaxID=474952 RepID=A0A239MDT0_9BACT|nr:hypothetical protein [Granulicella rosea]SNT40342.1 hypothetical protein SAMN05421770_11184 [Granulicella rosea]
MTTPEIDDIATRNAKHGPNTKLILFGACVALLAVLIAAYFMMDWDGKRLIPKPDHTSRSLLPTEKRVWLG